MLFERYNKKLNSSWNLSKQVLINFCCLNIWYFHLKIWKKSIHYGGYRVSTYRQCNQRNQHFMSDLQTMCHYCMDAINRSLENWTFLLLIIANDCNYLYSWPGVCKFYSFIYFLLKFSLYYFNYLLLDLYSGILFCRLSHAVGSIVPT